MARKFLQIFVTVNSLNLIIHTFANIESQNQAFIQTDSELRYVVGGVDVKSYQEVGEFDAPIKLVPPMLDFGERPVGMPHQMQVTLVNNDQQSPLHLSYISGNTPHFHCSFFESKTVQAGANTTFDVVFLARHIGNVENTLYIHTKDGAIFKYNVFGVGTPNPYRVRPLVGARLPLNSSFSPLIHMHNPHSWPLQVTEMYSSGGDLHLELPTGQVDAPKQFWQIEPFHTKPVMRASFVARTEEKHTAFIRIKTSHIRTTSGTRRVAGEELVLPVEVEVSSKYGIYSPVEMLDFGLIRSSDSPKSLKLSLLAAHKAVYITNVRLESPNDAVTIDFRPVTIKARVNGPTHVATVHFAASKVLDERQFSGKIIVETKLENLSLIVPYQATVMQGRLEWNLDNTLFYTGHPITPNTSSWLSLINHFKTPLVIYNATISDPQHFSVANFSSPLLLEPGKNITKSMRILFHPASSKLKLRSDLVLHTNASTFNVPLYAYNGWLKVVHHRPEIFKGQLDFGTLGISENRVMTFTLRNDNPVNVVIKEFGSNFNRTVVSFLGLEKGNGTLLRGDKNNSDIETNPLILPSHHFAVFNVNLTAPPYEGTFAAEVILATNFQNLYIPLTLRTAEGSLSAIPPKIALDDVFPTRAASHSLQIRSTFRKYMQIKSIRFEPNDTRFYYEPPRTGNKYVILNSGATTNAGTIHFDALRSCRNSCYLGLPTNTPAGHQWLVGANLDKDVADVDQYLYTRFRHFWKDIKQSHEDSVNVTVELNTNEIRGFLYPAVAHMIWPSVVNRKFIKFPLTQLGNTSSAHVDLHNPSDLPILFQVLPLSIYPSPHTVLNVLSEENGDMDFLDPNANQFSLLDLTYPGNETANQLRKQVERTLGVKPHPQTLSALVAPRSSVRVLLGFRPTDDTEKASLILIRNNLTVMDSVVVQGQGASGYLKLSGTKQTDNSLQYITFDYTERQLKNCDRRKSNSKASMSNFVLRRTTTAKNTGLLPFYINSVLIDGEPCSSGGFSVMDCSDGGFSIGPNMSKKIEILFTPDFTMSRLDKTLAVYSSIQPNVPHYVHMHVSIPPHLLWRCALALPRPPWERMLYYFVLGTVGVMLVCTLLSSYFDADRLLTADVQKRIRVNPTSLHKFDLNNFHQKHVNGTNQIHFSHHNETIADTPRMPPPRPKKQQQTFLTKFLSFLWGKKKCIVESYRSTGEEDYCHSNEQKTNNIHVSKNREVKSKNEKKKETADHSRTTSNTQSKRSLPKEEKNPDRTKVTTDQGSQISTSTNGVLANSNNISKKAKKAVRKNSKTPPTGKPRETFNYDADKDETSSTTTETSSTDPEPHQRVPTPELLMRRMDLENAKTEKKIKSKSLQAKEKKSAVTSVPVVSATPAVASGVGAVAGPTIVRKKSKEETVNEDEFILTGAKARQARRKEGRNSSKSDTASTKETTTTHSTSTDKSHTGGQQRKNTGQSKDRSKRGRNNRGNGRSLTATSSSESTSMSVWSTFSERPKEPDAFSDTTTPVWEMPQSSSQFTPGETGDLSELSNVTEMWDRQHHNRSTLPKASSPSEQGATYSQVVMTNNCSQPNRGMYDSQRSNTAVGQSIMSSTSQWNGIDRHQTHMTQSNGLSHGILEDDSSPFDFGNRPIMRSNAAPGVQPRTEWSDFPTVINAENLWDADRNPSLWRTEERQSTSTWGCSEGWNPMSNDDSALQNIWKNTSSAAEQKQEHTPATFDMFQSLGNIWTPASTASEQRPNSGGWGQNDSN